MLDSIVQRFLRKQVEYIEIIQWKEEKSMEILQKICLETKTSWEMETVWWLQVTYIFNSVINVIWI